jgi:hypothetical protein
MVVASLATVVVALAVPAHADSTMALSESLFDEGRRLMTAGQYAEACPKLEESYRLDPATGTLLNLATCHEKSGKTATAWAEYREAIAAARRDGRPDRVKFATEHAAALESKLSRLTISVSGDAETPGLEVRLDGKGLGKGSWGVAVPVDPGKHRVSALAPGKKEWGSEVDLGAAADQRQVTVPLLSNDPAAGAGPAANDRQPASSPSGVGPGSTTEPAGGNDADRATSSGTWRRPLGYAVGGLGLVGIGVGVGFAVDRSSKMSDRNAICPSGVHCTADQVSRIRGLEKQARTSGQVATVGFVSGGIALAAGVLLVLTAPSKPVTSAFASIRVSRDAEATWVSAGGAW